MPNPLTGPLTAFAARLRFPTLFKITMALMLLSWLLPDPIPFIDEIVTALATLMLASWRRKDDPPGTGKVIEGESRRE
ncbi:DUF6116 family protein [Arenimonas aestuarii]